MWRKTQSRVRCEQRGGAGHLMEGVGSAVGGLSATLQPCPFPEEYADTQTHRHSHTHIHRYTHTHEYIYRCKHTHTHTCIYSFLYLSAAAAAKSLQLCPTLCNPIDSSPPGSRIPGILQTRTLEWVAISFSNA